MSPRILLSTCLLLLAPLAAGAQTAADSLPPWEQLSPQQRELLLAPLRDRWNASEPESRRKLMEHARRWQSMSPDERARARHGHSRWKDMPPEKRREARALFEHMRSLPEAERKAMVERWKAMTPEQRRAWVEAHPPNESRSR